jgi:hypothetical protein
MSTKTPECWANDPQARALRIERSPENSLVLPFDQFAFAELKSDGKKQRLRLVFATHEVLIHGHSLRRIETAVQRQELAFIGELIRNQWSLIPDGQPVIEKIIVNNANDLNRSSSEAIDAQ